MSKLIIQETESFVRNELGEDTTGHDWFHIERVRQNAMNIWKKENTGDPFIIEMAALLHDISDEKVNESAKKGEEKLNTFLEMIKIADEEKSQIKHIIETISFKGGRKIELTSIEAKIVQDADRLDAIGAIGIARAFAYGGKKGQPIYDPQINVRGEMKLEEYRDGKSTSIHHFYEKLLKLKDLLNTESAKKIAESRHHVMEVFLEEFFKEWNGQS
ncbi:HD domain-containing protein [Neobacillus sp. PS3-40]|uniref:HD domain-containing protein n=1 Tax=Neobacillus sp. PS3-40 TaxID=3070679 RepID=UPI0027DF324F|nr:HD domain-containing protein [Neobacillus sp. PS3-40]WML45019.1 HD domain-containing protein [Neobacillus sp. PS3-40]